MRMHIMTDISDRVEQLKKDFLNPDTPDDKKAKIIDIGGTITITSLIAPLAASTVKMKNVKTKM